MKLLKKIRSFFTRRRKKLPEDEGGEVYGSTLGRDWTNPPESKYFSPHDE
jgi:hypothetical protein